MLVRRYVPLILSAVCFALAASGASARTTEDDIQKEIEDLRKRLSEQNKVYEPIGKVDQAADNRFKPNQPVTTATGKLEIGGLIQIWNYRIDNDHQDVFGDRGTASDGNNSFDFNRSGGTGEAIDNNGYRIRRAEIRFNLDITENITGVVMIDPAREATSYPDLPSNQGLVKAQREAGVLVAPLDGSNPASYSGGKGSIARVQQGSGETPRLLQDAYINIHSLVPHHDFTFGQFKPPVGEEGTRNSAYLDFAERAMVTQINDNRDLGVQVHGSWYEDRLQYWAGLFDGAGNYFGTAGQFQNRSDDNDAKDIAARILIRPIWGKQNASDCECAGIDWGKLELGYSIEAGTHGESGNSGGPNDVIINGVSNLNGLNRRETSAMRQAAWLLYRPSNRFRGAWLRGEWGMQHDRNPPGFVSVYSGIGGSPQLSPNPISRSGYYVSTGYKLTDSIFAERLSKGGFWNNLIQPTEFVFRYENFQNIMTEDLVNPSTHTDIFSTDVLTGGVNYYMKAYNSRVQMNYMIVNEHEDDTNHVRGLREVTNNVFIFTYQLSF